jgi:transcriptional regulator with XRE-family HTH domain
VSISKRLKEERNRLGMSQTKFGEIGGVTKKTQMLYESGDRMPDAVYLRRIACIGVDVQYIVIGLPSANLMNAMISDKFIDETNHDSAKTVFAYIDDAEAYLKKELEDVKKYAAEKSQNQASLSPEETALIDNFRHIQDKEDKTAVSKLALRCAEAATSGKEESGKKKRA